MSGQGISESLTLDITAALQQITALENAATAALARVAADAGTEFANAFQQQVVDVVVEADTADADAAIQSLEDEASQGAEFPVEAVIDGAEITAEIDDAVDAADTTVTIEADTAGATESIGALSDAAGGASVNLGGVADAAGKLGGASQLAAGETAGLAIAAGNLSGAAAGVAGGLLAIGTATAAFVSAAVEADTAQRRFDGALGEFATTVEQIDIGGLNESISELAVRLGSSDDSIRNAVASLAELGRGSGASRAEIAKTAEQLVALAARAVAVNPALGDVGDVTQQMALSLQRGERFAARFGLTLDATAIATRALRDSGKATVDQLTIYEKTAAAAAIATEQLGNSLGKAVDEGAESAELRLKSLRTRFEEFAEGLGTPLIQPAIELLEALEPSLEELARAFAELAAVAIPVAASLANALAPAIRGTADVLSVLIQGLDVIVSVLGLIPDGALAAAATFVATRVAIVQLGGALIGLAGTYGVATAAAATFEAVLAPLAIAAAAVAAGFAIFGGDLNLLGDDLDNTAKQVKSFTNAILEAGTAGELVIDQAIVRKISDLDAEFLKLAVDAGVIPEVLAAIKNGGDQAANAANIQALILDRLSDSAGTFELRGKDVKDVLEELAPDFAASAIVAEALAGGLDSVASSAGNAAAAAEDLSNAGTLIARAALAAVDATSDLADAQTKLAKDSAEANKKIAEARASLASKLADIDAKMVDSIRDVDQQIADAQQGIVDSFLKNLPSASSAVTSALAGVRAEIEKQIAAQSKLALNFRTLGADAADAINLDSVIANLQDQTKAIGAFFATVQSLASQGLDDTVQVLLEQGPEAGAALAAALATGSEDQRRAFEETVEGFDAANKDATDIVKETAKDLPSVLKAGAEAARKAFESEFDIAAPAEASMQELRDEVVRGLRETATLAGIEAATISQEIQDGITEGLNDDIAAVAAADKELGRIRGIALGEGIAEGIVSILTKLDELFPVDLFGDLSAAVPATSVPAPVAAVVPSVGASNVDRFQSVGDTIIINNPQPVAAEDDVARVLKRRSILRGIN